jgi:hypothetical protein
MVKSLETTDALLEKRRKRLPFHLDYHYPSVLEQRWTRIYVSFFVIFKSVGSVSVDFCFFLEIRCVVEFGKFWVFTVWKSDMV